VLVVELCAVGKKSSLGLKPLVGFPLENLKRANGAPVVRRAAFNRRWSSCLLCWQQLVVYRVTADFTRALLRFEHRFIPAISVVYSVLELL